MDPLGIFVTVTVVYILLCILVSLFIDADATTYLYGKFGPSVSKQMSGKVIWIIGAGRGLGAAIAVSAASQGARLVLSARTRTDLEKVKTECLEAGRYKEMKTEDVLVLPLDVSNTLEHEASVKKVLGKMGKISGLLHCVGSEVLGPWHLTRLETDLASLHSCVLGPVSLTRAVLTHMMERSSGLVAVVTCAEARLALPLMGTMAGYTHALSGYFQALRHEVMGCGISVSQVVAGPVDKAMPERVRRMADLCLVSVASGLSLSWVARWPHLTGLYIAHYFPDLVSRMVGWVGPRVVANIRGKYGATDDKENP